jgi:hypothetical protein
MKLQDSMIRDVRTGHPAEPLSVGQAVVVDNKPRWRTAKRVDLPLAGAGGPPAPPRRR